MASYLAHGTSRRWGIVIGVATLIVGIVSPAAAREPTTVASDEVLVEEIDGFDLTADKLIASSQSGGYSFGYAVAVDDDTIVVGAPRAEGDQGKAYIVYNYDGPGAFSSHGLNCEHDLTKFPDGNCGRSVAVHDDRVAIGMPHWPGEPNLDDRGAVWVAEYSGSTWESWPLVRGSVLAGYFGESVAIEDSTLAIGSPMGDINSSSSVKLYEPTAGPAGGHWEREQVLEPAGEDSNFAWSIATQGSTLALGVTAGAYVYHGTPGSYTKSQEFQYGHYGQVDVALDGDWLVVGNHDEGGSPPGAVHVYKWNGTRYVDKQTLTPPDGDHELYGWSVDIAGDTIVVGDPRDHGEAPYAGAVHRYSLDGTSWSYVETITAYDAAEEDQFGWDVAIAEDWIVVGAPWDDNGGGTDAGAIYIYPHEPPPPPVVECDGIPASIVGTDGDDDLAGTAGFDVIVGLGGNDTINGKGGGDLICGGPGNDRIYGGSGSDRIFGDSGKDKIEGNGGDDILYGGGGKDRIHGNSGDDIIKGNAGDDKLKGGGGSDSIYGGTGRDLMIGGLGDDYTWGGKGVDTASYADATSGVTVDLAVGIVFGGAGIDLVSSIRDVIGSGFADQIDGDKSNNRLTGGAGADVLSGKAGDDVLKGGAGNDSADGGGGRDTCRAEVTVSCEA